MQPGNPCNHETKQPCNQSTMKPSNQATIQPCNHATMQPSNQATKQPCNHATKQPYHNMRYQTDLVTESDERWLRSWKVSILDIFWRLIMLIMQNWDFSGTWILLQMLLPILYLHNMRYQTNSMTQIEEKWLRSRKVSILDIFWRVIMLIMQKWDFSGTLDLLQMPLPIIYLHNMRYWIDPRTQFRINWLRSRKNSKKLDFGLKKCQ